jgi:hypothetical protein
MTPWGIFPVLLCFFAIQAQSPWYFKKRLLAVFSQKLRILKKMLTTSPSAGCCASAHTKSLPRSIAACLLGSRYACLPTAAALGRASAESATCHSVSYRQVALSIASDETTAALGAPEGTEPTTPAYRVAGGQQVIGFRSVE